MQIGSDLKLWSDIKSNVRLFAFSGVIGAGKTTLLKLLKEHFKHQSNIEVLLEPVNLWRRKGWLQKFYTNPKRYALPFQILVYKTHIEMIQKCLKRHKDTAEELIILVERSMYDQLLFWTLQEMDSMEDEAYRMDWSLWMHFTPPVERIFYCRMPYFHQTLGRISERGRPEEVIDDDYHLRLHTMHEEWYGQEGEFEVTELDMSVAFHTDSKIFLQMVAEIEKLIK